MMFRGESERRTNMLPNHLVLRIQPNEGINMDFNAKVPGAGLNISRVSMGFDYKDYFHQTSDASGYETLIYDCLCGDVTLFKHADNIEVCWKLLQPILDTWQSMPAHNFPNYSACSWGPEEAEQLLSRDGFSWKS